MKTAQYIALVLFFVSALGGGALLLLQNNSATLQPSTQASQDVQFNWGEGSEVKWSENSPRQPGQTPANTQLARN